MEPIATFTAEQVAASVVAEAIEEVTGESSRRWDLKIVVIVVVVGVAWYLVKRRRETGTSTAEPDAAT